MFMLHWTARSNKGAGHLDTNLQASQFAADKSPANERAHTSLVTSTEPAYGMICLSPCATQVSPAIREDVHQHRVRQGWDWLFADVVQSPVRQCRLSPGLC